MKTSIHGIAALLQFEGIILQSYKDTGGVLTIGAGHTAHAGDPIPTPGMEISLIEAINIFRSDIVKYEKGVRRHVKVDLTQNQFDAVVSWHFNTGAVASATLTKKLNAGDFAGAAAEFARWNKDNGKVIQGLVNRREKEAAIFSSADYGDPKISVKKTISDNSTPHTLADIQKLFGAETSSEEEATTSELLANPRSRLLPRLRPRQEPAVTRALLKKYQASIPEDGLNDAVFVVAVRGYYANTFGAAGVNDRGVYDDAVFVVDEERVHPFNGNTDPSRFKKGIARLKAPQVVRYKPGPHGYKRKNGPYPAFRQDSDCTVLRDQKGEDTGMFYINLHRGGITTTSSAGCQTIPPHQWEEFRSLVNMLLKKNGQDTFYYLLVDNKDVPTIEEVAANPDLSTLDIATAPSALEGFVVGSVAEVQKALKFLGGDVGKVDNIFGPKTEQAIKRFQELTKLKATGQITPEVKTAIQAVFYAFGGK